MTNEADTNRPYPPPSNMVALLGRLRSRNLPEHIDADYLRDAGISEGTVSRALISVHFLGLVDGDGVPTQALRTINSATDEEYQATLGGLVREAYAEVFDVVDPATDSQNRILNVFRRYTPASQRNRQVIFFLGMCREAGIPVLDTPRQRSMREPGAARAPSATAKKQPSQASRKVPATGRNPALQGLIDSLPPEGKALSAQQRDRWLEMAKAALTFVYPEQEETNDADSDAEAS